MALAPRGRGRGTGTGTGRGLETPARARPGRGRVTPVRASTTLLVAIRHHLRLARRLPALAPDVSLPRRRAGQGVQRARVSWCSARARAFERASGPSPPEHLALAHRSLRVALAATRAPRGRARTARPGIAKGRRAPRIRSRRRGSLGARGGDSREARRHHARSRALPRATITSRRRRGDERGGRRERRSGRERGRVGREREERGGRGERERGRGGREPGRGGRRRAERTGTGGGADRNRGESESSSDGSRAFSAPMDFASGLRSEIGTLRRVVAGALSRRDAKTVFPERWRRHWTSPRRTRSRRRYPRCPRRRVTPRARAEDGGGGESVGANVAPTAPRR